MSLEDDPFIGRFFDTPDKKARWITRFKLFYILWIGFMIFGILFLALWFLFR